MRCMRIPSCPPCILCWLWRIQWAQRIHQNTGPALTMQQRPPGKWIMCYKAEIQRATAGKKQSNNQKWGGINQPWETLVGLCSRICAIKPSLRVAKKKSLWSHRTLRQCVWNWATSAADSAGCRSSRWQEMRPDICWDGIFHREMKTKSNPGFAAG